MPDIAKLRTAALHGIDSAQPLHWRLIITDSESLTGVALVCPSAADTSGLHVIADYPGGPKQDETGVYDCCPWPQFETYSVTVAEYVVAVLNADAGSTRCGASTVDREGAPLVCCKAPGHVTAGDPWHDMVPAGTGVKVGDVR